MPGQSPYKLYPRCQQPLLHWADLHRKPACPQMNTHPPVCHKLPFLLFELHHPLATPKDHTSALLTSQRTLHCYKKGSPGVAKRQSPHLLLCTCRYIAPVPVGNPRHLSALSYSLFSSFKASIGRGYLRAQSCPSELAYWGRAGL